MLLDGAAEIFERGGKKAPELDEDTMPALHAKIGELAFANEPKVHAVIFCHESLSRGSASAAPHDREEPSKSVVWDAMPLGSSSSRSSFYYAPQGEAALNLARMLLIDKQYLGYHVL